MLLGSYLFCGNFNGPIGKNADGYEGVHGGGGFGRQNLEGERILEFTVRPQTSHFKFTFHEKGESSSNISI